MTVDAAGPEQGLAARHAEAARRLPNAGFIIGGDTVYEGGDGIFEHVNPTTGKRQAKIPMASPGQVDAAVAAAVEGAKIWRNTHPSARRDILLKTADLIEADAEAFGLMGALENGVPSALISQRFAAATAGWFRYVAGWTDKTEGSVPVDTPEDGFIYTVLEPYGAVAIILTWNAPLMSFAMKVAPALAAGNSVVVKPAEITPFTALRCAELLREAGLPDGVLNLVIGGKATGEALVRHPGIGKISFTGGPQTARSISRDAAENLTPSLFELGGKGANLIFADADLETTIPFSVGGAFILSGQACAAPTRVLVEEPLYDTVVEHLGAAVSAFPIGDPLVETTQAGPLISAEAVERTASFIERAVEQGARLVTGGTRPEGELADGFFIQPAVLADVAPDSEIAQKEVFGPVISVTPFADEAEAVAIANSTPYGLVNYIQTRDAARLRRLPRQLRSGVVAANGAFGLHHAAPFGGVGLSGYGREGGREGLNEFLRSKTVMMP